ncbi:hypothetical protein AVEN_62204-1 [Araneus ventricosus]|uniref:Uncharacterized protein n=1 Tax=Araneus ventricosus TaxID=182803 RepID=A0A4Y2MA23_ARAVE|nr:hypothetical protein AVEN_62204-1 [Araneus ventricosus]
MKTSLRIMKVIRKVMNIHTEGIKTGVQVIMLRNTLKLITPSSEDSKILCKNQMLSSRRRQRTLQKKQISQRKPVLSSNKEVCVPKKEFLGIRMSKNSAILEVLSICYERIQVEE